MNAQSAMRVQWILSRVSALGLLILASGAMAAAPEKVDFNHHVKPLLSDRCFTCHGPDENTREAEMRLDSREGALAKSDKHATAIVPGDPDASELIRRIVTTDPVSYTHLTLPTNREV